MAESVAQVSYKKWLQSAFIIGIMFIIGLFPPFGQITPLGMKILGIFLGCIAGWCMGQMIWPSILGLILAGLTDYSTVGDMFTAAFGNTTL